MLNMIVDVLAYAALGTILMAFVSWVFDLIVPYDFHQDIADGNKAAGWVCAGIFIGIGYLLHCVIADYSIAEELPLLTGICDTVIWALIALVLLVAVYFLLDLILFRKINFNEEIQKGNEACGIVVFGIILGLCFIISAVVM